MSSTAARPRRYADLVQQIDGKRRDPVVPGSWVVVPEGELASSPGISLALVVSGPSYQHADGVAIQAVWRLHDGREVPQLRLTAVDMAELLESATDALRWLRNGVHPDRILPEMLRAHRAGSLARRALGQGGDLMRDPGISHGRDPGISRLGEDDRLTLQSLVEVSAAIADLEQAWREMVRSRLPNLVRSLWLAGALEISRRANREISAWESNTWGEPHPLIAGLAPADLAAIGWPASPARNPLVEVMQAIGVDARQASEIATDEIRRAAGKP